MMKVTISSIEFNYANDGDTSDEEVKNVTVSYRGRTSDYNNNMNGNLKIDTEEFYANSRPKELEAIVKSYMIGMLTEVVEEGL